MRPSTTLISTSHYCYTHTHTHQLQLGLWWHHSSSARYTSFTALKWLQQLHNSTECSHSRATIWSIMTNNHTTQTEHKLTQPHQPQGMITMTDHWTELMTHTGWLKKSKLYTLVDISTEVWPFFKKFFHCYTQQEICNKRSLQIPPHLNGAATLPCEILMSENIAYTICCGSFLKYKLARDMTYGRQQLLWQ